MPSAPDSKPTDSEPEPPVLLVVEDEDTVRNIATRTLTDAGYRVIPAADPGQAAAKFRMARRRIDLLVADVVLPHRYGTVLYQELQELQPSLKVLFISGFPDIGRGSGRTRLPGTPFLYKPFTAFDLRRAVARIIAGEEWEEDDARVEAEQVTLQPDGQVGTTERRSDRVDEPVTGRAVGAGLLGV